MYTGNRGFSGPRTTWGEPGVRAWAGTEDVEVARAESERGEVVLRRRVEEHAADALELRANGVFVMDTKETSSEVALAAAALDLVDDPRRVVVGGLGLGFTAQRVLADHRVEDSAWSRSRAR